MLWAVIDFLTHCGVHHQDVLSYLFGHCYCLIGDSLEYTSDKTSSGGEEDELLK